ncbi:MAG: lactate utilization protein [Thermoprotei archaeon]|nr:MAG: lactate utilization protein [Thermoprotei archaeon]
MSVKRVREDLFEEYFTRIEEVLYDEDLRRASDRATETFASRKESSLRSLPYIKYYRKRVREVKAWSIEHLDELIHEFKEKVEDLGGKVYLAKDRSEACRVIGEIVGSGKIVLKSKSMTTEEIELNSYLERLNNTVIETDLGERIVQLLHDKPSHVVVPAVHISRERIAQLFSKVTGKTVPPDPSAIVKVVRGLLRDVYMKADVGISGANALAANTGSIVIVENEGNARFVTNAPPTHVVVCGMEKVVPTLEDAMIITQVLPPHATGQRMTSYISVITGPSSTSDIELISVKGVHGPLELHVVLLDNGRLEMRRDPLFKQALYCIRCGSCLNACPIYQLLGGNYGCKYFGGIGVIWTAFNEGFEKAAPLAFACTLCDRCRMECPLELDVPRMIEKLRGLLSERELIPATLKSATNNILEKGNPLRMD